MSQPITPAQLRRLQTLYSQFERHTLDALGPDLPWGTPPSQVADANRTSRLEWATQACGRRIDSFKDITLVEAKRLIEQLQGVLNVKAPNKSPRRQSRKHGQKLGTEGRRDQIHNETTIAGPAEFALIKRDIDRLGWSIERMNGFLFHSARGPLRGKTQIRTLSDANKAHWAMKNLKPDHERQTT